LLAASVCEEPKLLLYDVEDIGSLIRQYVAAPGERNDGGDDRGYTACEQHDEDGQTTPHYEQHMHAPALDYFNDDGGFEANAG
jgi:hypothetical protein